MADYQNTRDTIAGATAEERDQATLEGLVSNTLTELIEDGVTKLRNYAFSNNTALTSIYLPNLTETGTYSFYMCTGLESIDFPKLAAVGESTFNGCTNLKHVIIRTEASSVPTLGSTDAFTGTPILQGDGAIYVPNSMISKYKSHTYWKQFFIADVNDYPLSVFESITDDWATIVANPSQYSIGDTKQIDLGTLGKHYMELVAKGVDVKSDGSGNAPTTWISKTLIATHRMNESNNTNIGDRIGWEGSEMRTWLKNTVKPLIPETVRSAILTVNKVQSIYSGSAVVKDGQTTQDDVWIPSDREVGFGSNYETTGPVYSSKFNGNTSRIKYYNGSASYWWLRSANGSAYFRCGGSSGASGSYNASNARGVALGFCL